MKKQVVAFCCSQRRLQESFGAPVTSSTWRAILPNHRKPRTGIHQSRKPHNETQEIRVCIWPGVRRQVNWIHFYLLHNTREHQNRNFYPFSRNYFQFFIEIWIAALVTYLSSRIKTKFYKLTAVVKGEINYNWGEKFDLGQTISSPTRPDAPRKHWVT